MTTLRRLLLLIVVATTVTGCGLWSKVTGEERRAEKQAEQLNRIQQTCLRFADGFAGQVLESVGPLMKQATDPGIVDQLSYWQITQLNSAYTIATGPSPALCQLDFVVLATLSRMVVEDTLVGLDEDLLGPLTAVYRDLEREAWTNAATVLTPAQLEELRRLIEDWRARNPTVRLVGFVHFSEFAEDAGWSLEQQRALGSLLGLLTIDPLAGLDPAIKQIEQTRLLAERVIFYMQRVPYLLDLQTQRVVLQATLAPEANGRTPASSVPRSRWRPTPRSVRACRTPLPASARR